MQRPLFFELPDPSWCSWFSGFVDGEGYFQLQKPRDIRHTRVALVISLREDDKPIIEEIARKLKCGRIYYISYEHDRKRGIKAMNQWRWRVNRINQIVGTIIPLFEQFPLRTKKQEDYKIWKQATELISNKEHFTESGQRNYEFLYNKLRKLHTSPLDLPG